MRKLILILFVIAPLVAACQSGDREGKDNGTGTPGNAAAPPAQAAPATVEPQRVPAAPGSPATGTATASPRPPGVASQAEKIVPAPGEAREVVIPAGTELDLELENSVASDTSRVEDPVRAVLVDGVKVHGTTVLPAGSTVSGTVTNAKRPGNVKGVAELGIRFDTVKPNDGDASYRVRTGVITRRGRDTRKKDTLTIVGPAAGGALLGGILGGKKGALIGTTVGGGGGTAVVLSTHGKDVRLPKGARLAIKLLEAVTVRVPA